MPRLWNVNILTLLPKKTLTKLGSEKDVQVVPGLTNTRAAHFGGDTRMPPDRESELFQKKFRFKFHHQGPSIKVMQHGPEGRAVETR